MPAWKILVVDDEPRGVELMERVLRRLGDVHQATSVAEARELLARISFDAIVADQRMPGSSGVELLTEVAEKNDSIGRVLITGYTDIEATIAAINQGRIHAYLSKPCPPSQLRLTVESVLERLRLQRENNRLLLELSERNRKLVHATRLLRESQRSADRANRAKSAFLENLSHELRTPLTTIVGYAQLLADPELVLDERANALDAIRMSCDDLLAVIHDVQEVARAESGELEVELTTFPLAELFSEIDRSFAARAHDSKLELRFEIDPAAREIHSDPLRLRQVLCSAIEHALRFTRTGAVCVAARRAASPHAVEIEIADAAYGTRRDEPLPIADAAASRAGAPFADDPMGAEAKSARVLTDDELAPREVASAAHDDSMLARDPTETSSAASIALARDPAEVGAGEPPHDHGFGLTLSERMASLLGADLEIAPGDEAVRILVRLPMPEQIEDSGLERLAIEDGENARVLALFDARILIVTPNVVDQRILRSLLRRTGAQVDWAPDLEGAIALIQSADDARLAYTITVVDTHLRREGRSAAVALREQGFGGALVAIDAPTQDDRSQDGFDGALERPIDRLQLLELLGRLADRAAPIRVAAH